MLHQLLQFQYLLVYLYPDMLELQSPQEHHVYKYLKYKLLIMMVQK